MRILKSAYILPFLIVISFGASGESPLFRLQKKDTIKIGLLIQDSGSREARLAAELAIKQTNATGGINGQPVTLAVRSMERPWGTGAKQAVDLVFSENVWAIVGSHDGRNTHLAEQAITKTQTPFVSAWATDPTLTQAFVPWFFNIVPNNNQQAATLVKEIFIQKKYRKVLVLNCTNYESQAMAGGFLKEIKSNNLTVQPTQISFDENNFDSRTLMDQVKKAGSDCVVLFGTPRTSSEIIRAFRENRIGQPVYCDIRAVGENQTSHFNPEDYSGIRLVDPGFLANKKADDFSKKFESQYGWKPGAVAVFTFDALNIVIEAIKKSGSDRNLVIEFLRQTDSQGVTGHIAFDKNGNRLWLDGVVAIRDGLAKPVEK
jgi:ABC-type branched-subunit amino acid transport system substrate-binding protein